jgi:L-asparaginase II
MASAVPLVRVIRSGVIESVHAGHVAVCDADGRLLARLGDPDRLLFSRSATKPLQAAVSLRRMGEDLPEDLIAIMCASHNAEPVHRAAVRRLLRRGGVPVSALGCPPAFPLSTSEARRVARPTRLQHNCSGKHAGMLVASLRSGWALPTYLSPEHPLQREILGAVRRASGFPQPVVGVDGCGAPVHGVPLRAMATLFARLVRSDRMGRYASTAASAVAAMRSHPYLVAGSGRSDTLLMAEVPGVGRGQRPALRRDRRRGDRRRGPDRGRGRTSIGAGADPRPGTARRDLGRAAWAPGAGCSTPGARRRRPGGRGGGRLPAADVASLDADARRPPCRVPTGLPYHRRDASSDLP